MSDTAVAPRLARSARRIISDRDSILDTAALATGTCFEGDPARLVGRSVLIATHTQIASAAAMIELDGRARRITIAPPDLKADHLAGVAADAEVDVIVSDHPEDFSSLSLPVKAIGVLRAREAERRALDRDTEWVLLTSGTSGRPKMVIHTLTALTDAIVRAPAASTPPATWATFYDIRRYGGLQIFLRAILGGADLVLTSEDELLGDYLHRLGAGKVTAISGTPSHWRRVLMSHERGAFAPRYIRLSGEIADQLVLDGLRTAYPDAEIVHAYASTEAGVGFAVGDGLEGFPASLVDTPTGSLTMKVVDGSLRIKSNGAATRYIGSDAPTLADADGFVDTGDLVERRGNRFFFVGRRGGIINVGGLKVNPEEVEAALNRHGAVRMSLVRARKNPLIGAIVVADIVLNRAVDDEDGLKHEILEGCRETLERHKVPAIIRFVPSLALTPGGKLSRANG